MSRNVLSAHFHPAVASAAGVPAAEDGGFQAPGTSDFYWPLIGGDNNWAITRPSVVLLLSVALLGWFFVTAAGRLSLVPTKRQFLVEGAYGFVRNSIGRDVIGEREFRPFLPLLFTVFTMILLNNVFGIVPFVQFPTMSRVAFPIVLTLVVYVTYHVVAIRKKHGVVSYFKSLVPAGLPGWLVPIMFVLEVATYFFIRPLTLALRLFGNMLAGHLMLLVFILGGEYLLLHGGNVLLAFSGVMSFAFSILMTFFELLVEFLQAFIFTILTALYLADAVSESH
ncbi:MAG TPA: F0F1 ATP synthase subunit A [Intrasporangium sp.]|uniref:F0F1 ATP synthase subunit A n=1 Tax=Intrasporangium sp. TaxID=1925024 RepID=UPI002D78ACA8|nr:F0F1 ATP synthase subunit A [Intrasporangium sp.]HET7399558.1 F0F1 ATP synthase subunit A [Intrasporangium sp.]